MDAAPPSPSIGTAYDRVAYPSAIVRHAHPDRMAVIARLHGLSPPPVETARMLEIGGGDGTNAIALAAALPGARFLSFDLAESAVARGTALAAEAGLDNVMLRTLDILDARAAIAPGSFDYIVAHGVYAWVPAPVRAATMALIGHALSPDGVAFVSYNALPGGHIRFAMRDMLRHALIGIEGAEARIEAARSLLQSYAQPGEKDDIVVQALRKQAEAMLERPPEVLFHDELGEVFAPQSFSETVAAAEAAGLRFLNDCGIHRTMEGFAADAADDAALIARIQSDDYARAAFFRQTLFVRAERAPARTPQLAAIDALFASGRYADTGDGGLKSGESEFTLSDARLTEKLLAVSAALPAYVPATAFDLDDDRRAALLHLFDLDLLTLRTTPGTFAVAAPERPRAGRLIRAQIARGQTRVATLDHLAMSLDDPAARELLLRLDGSADRAALAPLWETLPHPEGLSIDAALTMLAGARLIEGA